MISKMIFLFFSLFLFGMEVESKTLAGQVRYITYVEFIAQLYLTRPWYNFLKLLLSYLGCVLSPVWKLTWL